MIEYKIDDDKHVSVYLTELTQELRLVILQMKEALIITNEGLKGLCDIMLSMDNNMTIIKDEMVGLKNEMAKH